MKCEDCGKELTEYHDYWVNYFNGKPKRILCDDCYSNILDEYYYS